MFLLLFLLVVLVHLGATGDQPTVPQHPAALPGVVQLSDWPSGQP